MEMTLEQKRAIALAKARKRASKADKSEPDTNIVEQAMTGVNEGLADVLSLPSTVSNAAGDILTRGVNRLIGTDLKTTADLPPELQDGPGTKQGIIKGLESIGAVTDVQPQNRTQEFVRGVGRELGIAAIPGAAAAQKANVGRIAAAEALAATGSQTGAVLTEDEPAWVQSIAQLLGGAFGGLAAIPRKPNTPDYDTVADEAKQRWEGVQNSDLRLTQQGRDDLVQRFEDEFAGASRTNRVSERNTPKAVGALEDIRTLQPGAHIHDDLVDIRRAIGRHVAGAADPSERRIGSEMKRQIDDYLGNLSPAQATGSDVAGDVENLRRANDATRRVSNADLITDELDRAGRRAARSGRGGNTINTVRQNIDKILNNRKLRAGFSSEDIQAMEDIVNGTPSVNAARLLAAAAPSTGALPLMGNMGAGAAAIGTGNPMFLAPGIAGQLGQITADQLTQKQTRDLIAQVLSGKPKARRQMSDAERAIVSALIASQSVSGATHQDTR